MVFWVLKKMETGSQVDIYPPHLSESDKHNQNPVKHAIQNLKFGCSKIGNSCGTGVLAYSYNMMEYCCNVNNYVARSSLNKCLLYETFWGETPYISMLRFKFWELVYFRNWTDKYWKVLMHPGIFVGLAWNFVNHINFKALHCNTDPHKCNMLVHRGVSVPRNL